MRISSDVSHIVVDADARVGVCVCVCASGGLEGSHTSNQPFAPKILADVHTISVGMKELFVDSVTNEKRDGKYLRLIGTGSSMTWRHVVEMMLTHPASLIGMPIIGLFGHTVRRFCDSLSMEVTELWTAAIGGHEVSARIYAEFARRQTIVPRKMDTTAPHTRTTPTAYLIFACQVCQGR